MGSLNGKIRQVNIRIIPSTHSKMPLEVQGKRMSPKSKKNKVHSNNNNNDTSVTTSSKKESRKYDSNKDVEKWVQDVSSRRTKHANTNASTKRAKTGTKKQANSASPSKMTKSAVTRRTNSLNRSGSQVSRGSSTSRYPNRRSIMDLYKTENLPSPESPEACSLSAMRLKHIVKILRYEDISKFVLIKNIEYAVNVLETAYKNETRRICNEEDEDVLSTASASVKEVPAEVRDWLASTFTRSLTNIKKREDKLRFRSVANAIRAGIVVDRIYRRMSSSVGLHVPPNVLLLMKDLDEWSFNVFKINEVGEGHALKYVGYELLQKHDLIVKFKINTQALDNFLMRMEQGYSKYGNTYHNLVHAADVTQTTNHLIVKSGLAQWLTELEIFAVIFSAIIHDFEHTGTTNAFHINTGSDVALMYNDKAVLENYHVSTVFRLMKDENFNILSNLRREEYKEFRAMVIDIVLATDMSYHFQQLKIMKSLLTMPENIDKSKALSLLVHSADISHPAKEWDLHKNWTELLVEEFFRQGDQEAERKLPISPLCDRKNTMVSESQIGFIDFIVDPTFQVLGDMLEKIMAPLLEEQQRKDSQSLINTSQQTNGEKEDNEKEGQEKEKKSRRKRTPSGSSVDSDQSGASSATLKSSNKESPVLGVKRVWDNLLQSNKQCWKEQAVRDAAKKAADDAAKLEEEERVISPNLGIITSKIALSDEEETKPKKSSAKSRHSAHSAHRKRTEEVQPVNGETAEKRNSLEADNTGSINQTNGRGSSRGSARVAPLDSSPPPSTRRSSKGSTSRKGSRESADQDGINGPRISSRTSRKNSDSAAPL